MCGVQERDATTHHERLRRVNHSLRPLEKSWTGSRQRLIRSQELENGVINGSRHGRAWPTGTRTFVHTH